MPKNVYISGAITGRPIVEAEQHFAKAESDLKEAGHHAISPMTIPHNHDKSWHNYMRHDVKALMDAEAIYMLKGWEKSKGARIELQLAMSLDMEIIFE